MLKDYRKLAYDFEVFSKAGWWMLTAKDIDSGERTVIVDDKKKLKDFYKQHKDDIWVGFNSREYDQYIFKAILMGRDPCEVNDKIIKEGKRGSRILKGHEKYQFYNFDLYDKLHSLKWLEASMGSMIKESDVNFDLDRPLTKEEVEETVKYCNHDVDQTIEVFNYKKKDFDSQLLLIDYFNLSMDNFNKTKAQLSATILQGVRQERIDDEFDFKLPDHVLQLDKYKFVYDWYMNPRNKTYKKKDNEINCLDIVIQGIEVRFAYGGCHGAIPNYHYTLEQGGILFHFDVESLYPSEMIVYELLSRNVLEPSKFKEMKDTRLKLKKVKDKRQEALKIVINGTFGISKDRNSPLYDPKMANSVCISGQLLILDLIEKVEPYGKFVNINTDGIFMWVKDEEDYKKIQDIAKEWENRTGLGLAWERYTKMYQRDVNNYICVEDTGAITSKGCVKKKSPVDNDLPIITEAMLEYCINGTPVEETINNCNELIKFQKIVQVTRLYQGAFYGTVKKETIKEKGKDKEVTVVDKGEYLKERVLRVFASTREEDMGAYKIKSKYKVEKIASTPDKCFIENENIVGVECPDYLDKQYYIDLAKDTLKDFLGQNDEPKEVVVSKEQQVINILNKNYPHFYDVLEDIKLNTKVTKTILEKYIIIDVFKRYGAAGKLLEYYRIWSLMYNKKSYKGLTLTKNNIDSPVIRNIMEKYSNYNAEKDNYTKLDSKAILYELFNVINVEDVHISKKLLTEFDLFSDVTLTDNTVDENVLFILAVNETKNPSIVAYNVKHGTVNFFKIPKAVFSILPLYRTDFIYAKSFEQLPKPIVIGKDQEGINLIGEHSTDKEWWINNYKVLIRDYDKYGSEE